MYIQDLFRIEQLEALHDFIRQHSLATLITPTPKLEAFLMPMEIASGADSGVLRGHVVRRNHLWTNTPAGTNVLAVFQGSNSYISPRWYVNGQRSGRVAPSWNYTTVHASGPIRYFEDAAWIHAHLTTLTGVQESHRDSPWQLADAPADFIEALVRQLIGVEIAIERIEGKRFVSQSRTPADRASLVNHLRNEPRGAATDLAIEIAALDAKPPQ